MSNVIDSSGQNSRGGSNIGNEEKNEVRQYLLGQLGEADEESLELRLLTDPAFGDEFDTIVDEITDQYVGNEIVGDERKQVEQYFLRSPERQRKAQFAAELLQRAAAERGGPPVVVGTGFLERARAFWGNQSFGFRVATTVATIIIIAGLALLLRPADPASGTYVAINLQISIGDRSGGAETKTVPLAGNAGIRLELTLPDQTTQANSYRVELMDDQQRSRNLPIAGRTDQSLIVTIPANEITRGSYIIQLYAVNPDGSEQRIRGNYLFNVE